MVNLKKLEMKSRFCLIFVFMCNYFLLVLSVHAANEIIGMNMPRQINVTMPEEKYTIYLDANSETDGNGTSNSPFITLMSAEKWAKNNPTLRPLYIRCKGHETATEDHLFSAGGTGVGAELVITSWDEAVTYTRFGELGRSLRLVGSHIIIDGGSFSNPRIVIEGDKSQEYYRGIRLGAQNGSYQTLWRVEIKNAGYMGIGTDGGEFLNVYNCLIHDNKMGMYPNSGNNVNISFNYIYNNNTNGIHHNCHFDAPYVGFANNWVYEGNLIRDSQRNAFASSGSPTETDCGHIKGIVVKNNILVNMERGWEIGGVTGVQECTSMEDIKFYNNTFYNNQYAFTNGYKLHALGIVRNNLFINNAYDYNPWAYGVWEDRTNNVNAPTAALISTSLLEPGFMKNNGTQSFVNSGYNGEGDGVLFDYFGNKRAIDTGYDIGAYEYTKGKVVAPPTSLTVR